MSRLYNPKEAGERLRISESTVYRFFRAHKLKGVKFEGALRFTEEELMAFIEHHREQVEPKRQETRALSIPHIPKISFS